MSLKKLRNTLDSATLENAIPLRELRDIIDPYFPYEYSPNLLEIHLILGTINDVSYRLLLGKENKIFDVMGRVYKNRRFGDGIPPRCLFVLWFDDYYLLSISTTARIANSIESGLDSTIRELRYKGELANKSCADIYDIASARIEAFSKKPAPSRKPLNEGAMITPDGTLLLTAPGDIYHIVEFHYPDDVAAELRKWHGAATTKRQSQPDGGSM